MFPHLIKIDIGTRLLLETELFIACQGLLLRDFWSNIVFRIGGFAEFS